jgi:hypothetical protein
MAQHNTKKKRKKELVGPSQVCKQAVAFSLKRVNTLVQVESLVL